MQRQFDALDGLTLTITLRDGKPVKCQVGSDW